MAMILRGAEKKYENHSHLALKILCLQFMPIRNNKIYLHLKVTAVGLLLLADQIAALTGWVLNKGYNAGVLYIHGDRVMNFCVEKAIVHKVLIID